MNHVARIIERLNENKTAFKMYASYERATKEAENVVNNALIYYDAHKKIPMNYVVTYIPTVEKYVLIFDLSGFMRNNDVGGYLGWIAQQGHYSF